jgi:hypothetical protein
MLLLILTHRHMRGLVQQDVGGHQDRVGIEAQDGIVLLLARLFLELGHAVQPAERRVAGQDPVQFGMAGHRRLVEQDVLVRIDPRRDIGGRHLADIVPQGFGVMINGHGVQIDDAENRVHIVLQLHPVLQCAEIIAEVELAGRLHAGKDKAHRLRSLSVACGRRNAGPSVSRGHAARVKRRACPHPGAAAP